MWREEKRREGKGWKASRPLSKREESFLSPKKREGRKEGHNSYSSVKKKRGRKEEKKKRVSEP